MKIHNQQDTQVPNSTRCQIFLRDPNNVEIELNYDTKNEPAA